MEHFYSIAAGIIIVGAFMAFVVIKLDFRNRIC